MEHSEEEVEDMYEMIEQLLDYETKGKDYTAVMGDFNAIVGEGKKDGYVGYYGIEYRNDCGQMLEIIAKEENVYR